MQNIARLPLTLGLALGLAALAPSARAQATGPTYGVDSSSFGPQQGSREFTLSGSGTSNKQLSDSLGGATLSLGQFVTPSTELLLRQTVDYANPSTRGVGQTWNGSTKIALDEHLLAAGRLRPFVGVNLGYIYGHRVNDTWGAGLEAGLKYYVLPRTFLFAEAEYDWFFRHIHNIGNSNKFNDGQFNWSLGVGFNF